MRTYGTAKLVTKKGAPTWKLDVEPQVSLRLKRMFGRIGKKQQGTIELRDNIEICRELAWFFERYPVMMSADDAEHLRNGYRKHVDQMSAVERILAGSFVAGEFNLALPMREYQRSAAELTLSSGSLLLTDDLGLGKTISALGVISDPRARPAVVVTLTHLPRQWKAQVEKFLPGLRVHIVKKGTPYDLTLQDGRRKPKVKHGNGQVSLAIPEGNTLPDVIVLNYHKLSGWAETLSRIAKCVVYDEAQELRTGKGDKYAAAELISATSRLRMGLTATPVYNYGIEIYHVLQVINPDALGTREEFCVEWCTAGDDEKKQPKIKDPKAFGMYAREQGWMLRRTRRDVARELPPLTRIPHYVDADPEELAKVNAEAAALAKIILTDSGITGWEKLKASEELSTKMRQATGIAKAPYVASFVKVLVESGERVVLYAWHRAVYDILRDKLKDCAPVFYTGEESVPQKQAAFEAFVAGRSKVLVMSLRAGAGLDGLQHVCRTVVFGELDWSPGVHEQCIGRVERDEQKDPVAAYFLIADCGSDPVVADVLGLKESQAHGIRDPLGKEDDNLLERLETDGEHVRRLAMAVLAQPGPVAGPPGAEA